MEQNRTSGVLAVWMRAVRHAVSTTTRLTFQGNSTEDEEVRRKSCIFHPVLGIGPGLGAALPALFVSQLFGVLQGLVLLSSVLYLFLLEWLTRFRNFRDFSNACELLSRPGITSEERAAQWKNRNVAAVGSACTGFLIAAKTLGCYLLFTRLALFGNTVLLGFALIVIPVAARCAVLFLNISRQEFEREEGNEPHLVKTGWLTPLIPTLILAAVSVAFLGLTRYFGVFLSLSSFQVSAMHLEQIAQVVQHKPEMLGMIISRGIRDTLFLLAGGFLACQYWSVEASKKIGVLPDCFRGAVIETAELAALTAFLIIADNGIF